MVCVNFTILLPLNFTLNQILVTWNGQNVIFGNFRDSELGFLVNLSNYSSPKFTKIQRSESKIAKEAIFKFQILISKNWFHVKLGGNQILEFHTVDLNFTFLKFLEHGGLKLAFPLNLWKKWTFIFIWLFDQWCHHRSWRHWRSLHCLYLASANAMLV